MERQTWKGHWRSSDLTRTLHKCRNPEIHSASFKINKQLSWKSAMSSEPCTDVPAFLHFPGRRSPLGNGDIGPVPYRGDTGGRVLDMLSAQLARMGWSPQSQRWQLSLGGRGTTGKATWHPHAPPGHMPSTPESSYVKEGKICEKKILRWRKMALFSKSTGHSQK